jgi:hypothetical protein
MSLEGSGVDPAASSSRRAPRIDPNQSATFDMEIQVPADARVGRTTLLWRLQAPGLMGGSQKFEFEVLDQVSAG